MGGGGCPRLFRHKGYEIGGGGMPCGFSGFGVSYGENAVVGRAEPGAEAVRGERPADLRRGESPLMEADFIDRHYISVMPTILGQGIRLFRKCPGGHLSGIWQSYGNIYKFFCLFPDGYVIMSNTAAICRRVGETSPGASKGNPGYTYRACCGKFHGCREVR